ncbi:GDP-fucose protein O-fucosyltransferase [Artemisia annua]|uniref:O-fucosyltransferase family protein n=1 Tax=Artemisia annua TaxID=35608 RepID=A0A2U1LVL9_ARTAN|nr:GDP-fucose protein O-fucosyltransferase [Artemisia annua]
MFCTDLAWQPCAYQPVWKPNDIYQDDYFIDSLKPDIRIVKELPKQLQSLDIEAIGSVVIFSLTGKVESKLELLKRDRCNLHALQFTPKIQGTAGLLIQRMRQNATHSGVLYENLIGPFAKPKGKVKKDFRYLALHLRFEIDMVALSLCDFGGGEEEKKELQAYRAIHFPGLLEISWLWAIIGSQRLSYVNAVVTIGEAIIDGDHEGFHCLINSATPATCGAAILVPDINPKL